jgi:hypothetical protein
MYHSPNSFIQKKKKNQKEIILVISFSVNWEVFEELPANKGPKDENGSKIDKTHIGNHRNKAADTIIKKISVLGSVLNQRNSKSEHA